MNTPSLTVQSIGTQPTEETRVDAVPFELTLKIFPNPDADV